MRAAFVILAISLCTAGYAVAQDITTTPLIEIPVEELDLGDGFDPDAQIDEGAGDDMLDDLLTDLGSVTTETPREEVAQGPSATMRVLDKLTGEVTDLTLAAGETREIGFLAVTMQECRYPVTNPAGDAFVFVDAIDLRESLDVFSGWMIASAPALNALDHPRYDIWALRCSTS